MRDGMKGMLQEDSQQLVRVACVEEILLKEGAAPGFPLLPERISIQ